MKKEELLNCICSSEDPDMSKEAKNFYASFFSEYMESTINIKKGYRGDCLISLGWSFGKVNKTGIFDRNARSYTGLFNKEEIQLFYLFRERYHSRANFIILPRKLNLYRGAYRENDNDNQGKGSCDYPDILLKIIRSYYFGENVSVRKSYYTMPYTHWLNLYGKGEEGWRNFVDKNYLKPFVNCNYEVKDLFAPIQSYRREACNELVGCYHDFDYCLPRSQKDGIVPIEIAKDRVINFIKNSLWVWNKRAELIVNK